jgi:hypothetical protein
VVALKVSFTELPDVGDTVNLEFLRSAIGKSRGDYVCIAAS